MASQKIETMKLLYSIGVSMDRIAEHYGVSKGFVRYQVRNTKRKSVRQLVQLLKNN